MPVLIRIILQRALVYVFSILAFFGINPDLSIPSYELVQERKEIQQEKVEEILQIHEEKKDDFIIPEKEIIKDVEEKIEGIQKQFTDKITQNVVEKVENIVPTSIVSEDDTKFIVNDVVVNIICIEKSKSYTKLSSGSGVVVSPNGLILTNAHVTYPFLMSPQFGLNQYSCSVRRENIPNYGYNAELVYYPIDWLKDNKEIIKDPSPIGTGENDYAFLQITTPLGPTPKTNNFAHALTEVNVSDLKNNLPITVAGYPSTSSGIFEIDTKPGLKVAQTTITDFFTFNSRSYDVLQTGTNHVAYRGASGGGIFNANNLYGIVVTTNSNSNGSYINALTIPYIKKDFESDSGLSFNSFIQNSYSSLIADFNSKYKDKIKEIISGN